MAGRNHTESATQSLSRQGGREFLFFSDFPCNRKRLNASALYIGKLPACFRYCTYGQKKRRNPAKNKRGVPPIFCSVILHNPQAQPQLLMKTTASVTQKKDGAPIPFPLRFSARFDRFALRVHDCLRGNFPGLPHRLKRLRVEHCELRIAQVRRAQPV